MPEPLGCYGWLCPVIALVVIGVMVARMRGSKGAG
jgi:hypothetical protein